MSARLPRATPAWLLGFEALQSMIAARVDGFESEDGRLRQGDVALADTSRRFKSGDIVVCRLDGSGTMVRRLRIVGGDQASLESGALGPPPWPVRDLSKLVVLGVVVARAGRL